MSNDVTQRETAMAPARGAGQDYVSGTLDETRNYYYTDGWQVLEERLGTSTTPDRQFVWGIRYIDDLVLRDTEDDRLYALQDANWNITAVADDTGTVQERYEYDPYGNTTILAPNFTVRTTSNFLWETTYCGYHWDAATHLFAVRHRYYHPLLGNWLTPDPLQYVNGSNLYQILRSNVLVSTDPFGFPSFPSSCLGTQWSPSSAWQRAGCGVRLNPLDGVHLPHRVHRPRCCSGRVAKRSFARRTFPSGSSRHYT